MARSGITLKLEGFEDLLGAIQKAGGTIDQAAEQCMRESAQTMQDELTEQMHKANVDSGLVSRMPPPQIEKEHNRITARVGYGKGNYNPDNLSDGYEVVFLNFGTPHRTKHGKVSARGFIKKAKSKARGKIKKQQEETLNEILRGLQG